MINRDNYELFFFQYQEGMLSEEERREVESFALQHPDLAEELTLYAEAPVLTAEEVTFPDKESLRRQSPLSLWRYAAAAAVVTVVSIGGIRLMQQPSDVASIMVAEQEPVHDYVPILEQETPQHQDNIIPRKQIHTQDDASLIAEASMPHEENIQECIPEEEQETSESNLFDPQPLVGVQQEGKMLAYDTPQEGTSTSNKEPIQVKSTYIVNNQSDISKGELLADMLAERYPEQAVQLTLMTVKVMNTVERVKKKPIIQFIRSIV